MMKNLKKVEMINKKVFKMINNIAFDFYIILRIYNIVLRNN